MNIKLISKALHTLSLLSDEDVAIVVGLRGASEDERGVLMLALEPNSKPQKKSSKKAAGGGGRGKSKHASSLQQQISGTGSSLIQPPAAATTDDTDDSTNTRCQFTRADGKLCLLLPDHNIHHMKTASEYHEFVAPPATHAATGD